MNAPLRIYPTEAQLHALRVVRTETDDIVTKLREVHALVHQAWEASKALDDSNVRIFAPYVTAHSAAARELEIAITQLQRATRNR